MSDSQALALVLNLLISGTDCCSESSIPVFLPSPQILALAATLIVYPPLTTRLPPSEEVRAADDALFYLDHVNKLVGSRNAGFSEAFQFGSQTLTRGSRRRDRSHDHDSPAEHADESKIDIKLTNEDSIWNRAENFWHVVGWAFNCSVVQPRRWERWRLWLGLMLDVLEDDLAARTTESDSQSQEQHDETLLSQYLRVLGEGRSEKRKLMRAILADGSKKSLGEFGEIWKNETKERKATETPHVPKRKLDFENDEYADYMDLDSADEAEPSDTAPLHSTRTSSKRQRQQSTQTTQQNSPCPEDSDTQTENITTTTTTDNNINATNLGGPTSLVLRHRFLALLAKYSALFPHTFMDTEDLFDLYTEFIHPLPLPTFLLFTQQQQPQPSYLSPNSQASLFQTLLRPIISTDAPVPKKTTVSQADLEKHFLPFPANLASVEGNAKVSILVEGLMRLLWRCGRLDRSSKGLELLRRTVEKGIEARRKKATFDGRKKGREMLEREKVARRVLEESAERMRGLLDVLDEQKEEGSAVD